jgi:hypothetical protein
VRGRWKDDEATDQRGHSARGSERARERAADGWGRLAARGMRGVERAGARARRQAEDGPREEERGHVGRGMSRVWAGIRSSRERRKLFSFSFLLSNSYFPFFPFSFEQIILWIL